jgi:hypothetical protein
MTSRSLLLVVVLVAGSSNVAFARDHLELVCSAVASPADGGEQMPVFIHFFESRASDGESRDEVLSNIYQGRLFQGKRVNKSEPYSTNAPIVLKDGKRVRFRGTYTLGGPPDAHVMRLKGQLTDDPSARKVTYREVTVDLPCVDLSI